MFHAQYNSQVTAAIIIIYTVTVLTQEERDGNYLLGSIMGQEPNAHTIGIFINSQENPIKIKFNSENFKIIMKSYSP